MGQPSTPMRWGLAFSDRDQGGVAGVSGLYRLADAVMAALADQLEVARVVHEVRTKTNRPDVI